MKKLKNLKGAKILSKNEQQQVKGGKLRCSWGEDGYYCPPGYMCVGKECVPHWD